MQDDQDPDIGIISARPERGGAAQGPGSDLGLYAAPAEAFPAIAIGIAATMLPVTAAAHPTSFSGTGQSAEATAVLLAPAGDAAASSAAVTSFNPATGESGFATAADARGPAIAGTIAADTATPVPAGFATGAWFPGRLEAPAIAASQATGDAAGGVAPAQAAASGAAATDLTAPTLSGTATDLADPLLVQATLATGLIDATTQTLLTQALAGVTALDLVRDGALPDLGETVDTTVHQVALIGQDLATGLGDTLTGAVGALDAVTQTVAQPLAPVLTPALESVQQAGAALGQATTQTLETVAEVAAPVVGTVTDVATPLADTADGLVSSVIPAAVAGNVVGDTVAAVIPAVTDTLAGLTGADPAGGIGTLTSLVSAADMFVVNDDGPAKTGLGNVPGVGGLLDTLAPPLADTILLGGHDLSHGGLHDLDDLHLGLG